MGGWYYSGRQLLNRLACDETDALAYEAALDGSRLALPVARIRPRPSVAVG